MIGAVDDTAAQDAPSPAVEVESSALTGDTPTAADGPVAGDGAATGPSSEQDDGDQDTPLAERDLPPNIAAIFQCPLCSGTYPLTPDVSSFEPLESSHYRTCEDCDGFGKVRTGSRIADNAVVDCPDCEGRGFKPVDVVLPSPAGSPVGEPPWPSARWNQARNMWE